MCHASNLRSTSSSSALNCAILTASSARSRSIFAEAACAFFHVSSASRCRMANPSASSDRLSWWVRVFCQCASASMKAAFKETSSFSSVCRSASLSRSAFSRATLSAASSSLARLRSSSMRFPKLTLSSALVRATWDARRASCFSSKAFFRRSRSSLPAAVGRSGKADSASSKPSACDLVSESRPRSSPSCFLARERRLRLSVIDRSAPSRRARGWLERP